MFNCVKCQRSFSRQDSVRRHEQTVHLAKVFSKSNVLSSNCTHFICLECGMKFHRKDTLKCHILRRHIEEKFECHHCSANLRNKECLIRHLRTKHLNTNVLGQLSVNSSKKLECSDCGMKFCRKDILKYHIIRRHIEEKLETKYLCNTPMYKSSVYTDVLSRSIHADSHKSSVHGTNKFNCIQCGRLFSCQKSVKRHIKTVHPIEKFSEYFECSECGVKCRRKDALIYHIFQTHNKEKIECHHCGAKFRHKHNIIPHLRTKHSSDTTACVQSRNLTKKTCTLCRRSFTNRLDVLHHYRVHHHVQLVEQELKFNTHQEFLTWKKGIEDSTNSRFVVRTSYKQKKCTLTVFSCHRSGLCRIKSSNRKRRLKLKGSKRLDSECPAEMKLRQNNIDSTCVVSFLQTHLGHDLGSWKEVGYLYLHKDDRIQLATKIASGVPLRRILDDNQNDDLLLYDLNINLNRKNLLSNKDLHSIKTTFNLKLKKSEPNSFFDDVSCVETFVKHYADFILYYKKQHELSDVKFPMLKSEDIVLIFMSISQKELLMKHGSNVIAMDRIHGMDGSDFFLQTLLILDYDGEGFPVAFAISNRNDNTFLDIFLTCIRENVGILQPRTLMMDMKESYYNSWKKIMSIPQFHLFYPWLVREAWRNNLKKISNQHKREIVKKLLYDLSSETDEQIFLNKLEELINIDDADEFLKYFQAEYIECLECWAYCYWQAAGLNKNMHLEAFHKSIKFIHSRGNKMKELYSGLIIMRNILRRKLKLFRNKMSCGAITPKLRILRKEHNKSTSKNDFQVIKINEGEWMIQPFQAPDTDNRVQEIYYFVQKVNEDCPVENDPDYDKCNLLCAECGACAHLYRCTCSENSVKNNMCRHIHSVLSILNKNTSIKVVEGMNVTIKVEDISPTLEVENMNVIPEVEDTSPSLGVKGRNIIKYKEKLSNKFMNILNLTTSIDDLKVIESLLKPIERTIFT